MDIIKVLVVDDEQEICEVTRDFLRKRNYCTFGALNSQEAMEVVEKERPHLVVLDVRLGQDSGMDVLRQIKGMDKGIKVIMVTALDDDDSITQATALGADGYITKPFTAAFLNDLIIEKMSKMGIPVNKNKE